MKPLILIGLFSLAGLVTVYPSDSDIRDLCTAIYMNNFTYVRERIERDPGLINQWVYDGGAKKILCPLVESLNRRRYFDYFMTNGGDPNLYFVGDDYDITILMIAATLEDDYYARVLLEKGADITKENSQGKNALHIALSIGNNVDLFIRNFPDIEIQKQRNDSNAYIFSAIDTGSISWVRRLINNGFSLNALFEGRYNVVEYLLDKHKVVTSRVFHEDYLEMFKLFYKQNANLFINRNLAINYWESSWYLLTQIQMSIYDIFNERDINGECLLTDILQKTADYPSGSVLRTALRFGLDISNFSYNGLSIFDYCRSIGYSESRIRQLEEVLAYAILFDKTLERLSYDEAE
jgi:hypothetical protein